MHEALRQELVQARAMLNTFSRLSTHNLIQLLVGLRSSFWKSSRISSKEHFRSFFWDFYRSSFWTSLRESFRSFFLLRIYSEFSSILPGNPSKICIRISSEVLLGSLCQFLLGFHLRIINELLNFSISSWLCLLRFLRQLLLKLRQELLLEIF